MKKWTIDTSALLLRLAAGLIFFPHGYGKVFGAGGAATFAQDMPSYGVPAFLGYVAAYSELICAVLLIAGLLTRLDALLLGCTMFVATFVVQLPDALRDPQGGGNKLFAALHGNGTRSRIPRVAKTVRRRGRRCAHTPLPTTWNGSQRMVQSSDDPRRVLSCSDRD